jgi:hypothetical protein
MGVYPDGIKTRDAGEKDTPTKYRERYLEGSVMNLHGTFPNINGQLSNPSKEPV